MVLDFYGCFKVILCSLPGRHPTPMPPTLGWAFDQCGVVMGVVGSGIRMECRPSGKNHQRINVNHLEKQIRGLSSGWLWAEREWKGPGGRRTGERKRMKRSRRKRTYRNKARWWIYTGANSKNSFKYRNIIFFFTYKILTKRDNIFLRIPLNSVLFSIK